MTGNREEKADIGRGREMTGWILIFYLSGYNAGGPATAVFADEKACLFAIDKIRETLPHRADRSFAVCVPQTSANVR